MNFHRKFVGTRHILRKFVGLRVNPARGPTNFPKRTRQPTNFAKVER
jgi:hypothetical protein